jgi:uncharacterized protein YceK
MARRTLVLLVATLLLLGACSKKESGTTATAGADSSSTTTTSAADEKPSSTTTTEAEQLTEADLAALLLDTADLPPGWAAEDSSPDDDDDSGDIACPAGQGIDEVEGPEAEAEFSKGQLGPFALQSVIAPDDAELGMVQTVESLDLCIGSTWDVPDEDGSITTLTMSALSAPQVGDESAGYRLIGQRADGNFTMDVVVVRVGDVLTMFGGLSLITELGSFPLDSAEFAELVDAGVAKIAAA